jgi:hypothetical protein
VPDTGKGKLSLIKDAGISWKKDLKNFINAYMGKSPDVVIITGSPLMHFSLAPVFRQKFGSKVILDYRDPFASNPGFKNTGIKVAIKKWFERRINKQADALVTVNSFCANLIEGFEKKPNAIVQNGYDETVQVDCKPVQLSSPTFVYTGKFYFDPNPILKAFEDSNLSLIVAGPDVLPPQFKEKAKWVKHIGFVDYSESVQLIGQNDVGIIQTYGEDFQSTTKIFDYIRCKRAVLIVSGKFLRRGSIHDELKDYPNVFWAENTSESITETLREIQKSAYSEPSSEFHLRFSRKSQMMKLVALIEGLLK